MPRQALNPPRVFICSPYRGRTGSRREIEHNVAVAVAVAKTLVAFGLDPRAPHLYYTTMLDDGDRDQRAVGLFYSRCWLRESDVVLLVELPSVPLSTGQLAEQALARRIGKPIVRARVEFAPNEAGGVDAVLPPDLRLRITRVLSGQRSPAEEIES